MNRPITVVKEIRLVTQPKGVTGVFVLCLITDDKISSINPVWINHNMTGNITIEDITKSLQNSPELWTQQEPESEIERNEYGLYIQDNHEPIADHDFIPAIIDEWQDRNNASDRILIEEEIAKQNA
jgi:hypothetical protein